MRGARIDAAEAVLAGLLAERVGSRGGAALSAQTAAGVFRDCVALPERGARPPRFLAYSITKSFLALLVLQLREAGRLELDEPLARFAPDVPRAGEISLRQLLNHTAGLPDYGPLPAYLEAVRARPAEPWSFEEFAAHTYRKGLLFAPGQRFAYSNPGYALLRRLVERETGQTLREAIRERIAQPLGLRDTDVVESLGDLAGLVPAHSRQLGAGGAPVDVRRGYHPGWVWHGVIASTPADVCAFYVGLFGGGLVSAATLGEMTALVPVDAPFRHGEPGYGLGLMGDRSRAVYGHNGGGPGYTSSAFCAQGARGAPAAVCAMCAFEDERLAEDLVFGALERLRAHGVVP